MSTTKLLRFHSPEKLHPPIVSRNKRRNQKIHHTHNAPTSACKYDGLKYSDFETLSIFEVYISNFFSHLSTAANIPNGATSEVT